jgi:uncharacterized cofD-like protein
MRIVGIGGGTGLPVLLGGLKHVSHREQIPLDITAIVTVSDIRKCMISLAPPESVLTAVCQHRFEMPEGVAGHSLGNLILSALYQMSGNFAAAVRQACEILELRGRVLPATESPVTLCAAYENGRMARGEANIPKAGSRIRRVWLEPDNPAAAPDVLNAIECADCIVIGPGSLYTSIIPNLLVADVPAAILGSRAVKIYVTNLMMQPGETEGYSAADHLRVLLEYAPLIDVCVLNSSLVGARLAKKYLRIGSRSVSGTANDEDEIRACGVTPVVAPLVKDRDVVIRHDAMALARLVVSLMNGRGATQEAACR